MGIDKPDIRLVVHGDIPGSLENYLQEAGRAGRDREHANCVLLFANDDVERQFSLSARSRLARHEIGAILKALRRLRDKTSKNGKVIATSGEIVRAERDQEFERDSATDDTRVKTAVSWLEEAKLLSREENRVQVFPSSLRIRKLEEAEKIVADAKITGMRRKQLLDIVRHLMNAKPDQGISTDELTGASGLTGTKLNKAMADLETLGIASNDVAVTVFVHVGVKGHSPQRLAQAAKLEADLVQLMREAAPDAEVNETLPFNLTQACQALRNQGYNNVRPDIIEKLLHGIAGDGRDQDGGMGSIRLRKVSRNALMVMLQRKWIALEHTAIIRRRGAELLLGHLTDKVPKGKTGTDLQVETTMGDLLAALNGDAFIRDAVKNMNKLMERALLWLHEQEVVTLGKGLTVFRPAMTVHLSPGKDRFTQQNFKPLEEHYREQTIQTHVMAAYAEKGLNGMEHALKLSEDYFVLDRDAFLKRWLPERKTDIKRQTTSSSWKMIVDVLNNPAQQKIVADDREQTNVLVLAGPGSGKTRVLVHRIAYLVRVRREDPRGILVLTYNRHAAAEIRTRLRNLIDNDASGIIVSTCHAFAMRLMGISFVGAAESEHDFDSIILDAVRQLNGEGLTRQEAEAQRDVLIHGYRWILVDEYQDIGQEEYDLIAAVAGRSVNDPDLRLSLFAVGDDDQNIYAFNGASIDFIRKFDADYKAKPKFLIENYRSTHHIIDAANDVICQASERMKTGHDITVDGKRKKDPHGGKSASLDALGMGRVQLLTCPSGDAAQAIAAVEELQRLSQLTPDWSWSHAAIISRDWKQLGPVRAYAEALGIPVEMANERLPSIWHLREMQNFVAKLRSQAAKLLSISDLLELLNGLGCNRWIDLIVEGIAALEHEITDKSMPVPDLVEWFAEWARDTRSTQRGLLLLTAHRAKGLEFDDVVILDGDWQRLSKKEDADAPRRLFYVAMTRACRSLAVLTKSTHPFLRSQQDAVLQRQATPDVVKLSGSLHHYEMLNMGLVNLSWAGRLEKQDPTLDRISRAQVGDPVTLSFIDGSWMICDAEDQPLGCMARKFSPPEGRSFLRGEIGAVVCWRKSYNEEKYREHILREEWETVLPELVFS